MSYKVFAILILLAVLMSGCLRQSTCSDGVKNQLEEGVDCGGPCPPCVDVQGPITTLPAVEECSVFGEALADKCYYGKGTKTLNETLCIEVKDSFMRDS